MIRTALPAPPWLRRYWHSRDFEKLTRRLLEGVSGSQKVLSLLEGGYNPEVLGESVAAHLAALRAY